MANREHLEIVAKGAEAIAIWRKTCPGETLDLSGADLRRFDLTHAVLNGADMRGACLEWTDFRWADLIGANLDDSVMDRADFHKADLTNVSMRAGNLVNTNLEDACLVGADVTDAHFLHTRLLNTDLRSVKGLETCKHHGPSVIDTETMQKAGYLPKMFLRECGVSDTAIIALYSADEEALAEAMEAGLEYHSCFISYSSLDTHFVEKLRTDLLEQGVRCWFAPHDMKISAPQLDAIYTAIRQHEKLLLILSANSIASAWVEDEVNKAFSEERDRGTVVVFPVRIDDAIKTATPAWAEKLRISRNIGDFTKHKSAKGYTDALGRVLRDLKK